MPLVNITVDLWPPTTNTLYRNVAGRMVISKRARQFYADGMRLIKGGSGYRAKPLTGQLGMRITLYPPNKVRRDIDNHIKAICDLLTKTGVWVDDSQVDVLHVERGEIIKKGRFTVEIWQLQEKI